MKNSAKSKLKNTDPFKILLLTFLISILALLRNFIPIYTLVFFTLLLFVLFILVGILVQLIAPALPIQSVSLKKLTLVVREHVKRIIDIRFGISDLLLILIALPLPTHLARLPRPLLCPEHRLTPLLPKAASLYKTRATFVPHSELKDLLAGWIAGFSPQPLGRGTPTPKPASKSLPKSVISVLKNLIECRFANMGADGHKLLLVWNRRQKGCGILAGSHHVLIDAFQ